MAGNPINFADPSGLSVDQFWKDDNGAGKKPAKEKAKAKPKTKTEEKTKAETPTTPASNTNSNSNSKSTETKGANKAEAETKKTAPSTTLPALPDNRQAAAARQDATAVAVDEPVDIGGTWGDINADPDGDMHQRGSEGLDTPLKISGQTEQQSLMMLKTGFHTATALESFFNGVTDDDKLLNHFISGDGSSLHFGANSDMAMVLGELPAFQQFANTFEAIVLNSFNNGQIESFNSKIEKLLEDNRPQYMGHKNIKGIGTGLFGYAVMGGYVSLSAKILALSKGEVTIKYTFGDHFGAGYSDAYRSSLPGLPDMYYLQHYFGEPGKKYTPFHWQVDIIHTYSR